MENESKTYFKDFDGWNEIKKITEKTVVNKFFKERDIWWCKLGCNLGHEQDGKGVVFERPVLVIKKFNNRLFYAVPLSSKLKNNIFYLQIKDSLKIKHSVLISQMRLVDVLRLENKISHVDKKTFARIKKTIRELLL